MELFRVPGGRSAATGRRDSALSGAVRPVRQLALEHQVLRADDAAQPAGEPDRAPSPGQPNDAADMVRFCRCHFTPYLTF